MKPHCHRWVGVQYIAQRRNKYPFTTHKHQRCVVQTIKTLGTRSIPTPSDTCLAHMYFVIQWFIGIASSSDRNEYCSLQLLVHCDPRMRGRLLSHHLTSTHITTMLPLHTLLHCLSANTPKQIYCEQVANLWLSIQHQAPLCPLPNQHGITYNDGIGGTNLPCSRTKM